jgi:hypothetical protein
MKLNCFIEDFSWNSKCHCNQWLRITSKQKDGDNKHNEGMWDQHLSLFLDGLLLRAIIPTSNYSLTLKTTTQSHSLTLAHQFGIQIWMTIVPKKVKFKRPIDLNTISKESFLLAWDRDIYVFLMWERGITLNNELMFKNCRWMGGLNMLMMNVAVLFAESTLSLQLEVIFDFKMVTNSFGCRVLTVIWKYTKTMSPSETIVHGIKINKKLQKCQEIKELNYNLSCETESPN